jgi:hypothetical protein
MHASACSFENVFILKMLNVLENVFISMKTRTVHRNGCSIARHGRTGSLLHRPATGQLLLLLANILAEGCHHRSAWL